MANVTYRDLVKFLSSFDDKVLDQNISVFVPGIDEYFPVYRFVVTSAETCDVLDPNSIVLSLSA